MTDDDAKKEMMSDKATPGCGDVTLSILLIIGLAMMAVVTVEWGRWIIYRIDRIEQRLDIKSMTFREHMFSKEE